MERRGFLALCIAGGGVLAGCGADSGETPPETRSSGWPEPTPTDVPPLDATWRQYQHDAANTGATDDPGPVERPGERWRRAVTTGRPATSPAVVDGVFVAVTETGVVHARDAADGSLRWHRSLPVTPSVAPAAAAGTAVVADGRTLRGLAVDTGDERWTATLDAPVVGLDSTGDRIVAASESGVRTVAPADGTTRWHHDTAEAVVTPPGVGDGAVAVGLADRVVVLDAATGRLDWSSPAVEPAFAPTVGNGLVHVGTGTRIVALDVTSGDRQWDHGTEHPIAAPAAVTADAVYLTTLDDDAARPTPNPDDSGAGTSTPAPADTRWLAANLVALSPVDGAERWRTRATERYNFTSGPPDRLPVVVAGGRAIVGVDGMLRAYETETGDGVWTASGDAVTPAATGGVVSTGSTGIDPADGSVRWRVETGEGVSPPVVDGNTVYAGSDAGILHALAADAGTVDWAAGTRGAVRAAPSVGDDAVYAGTLDGVLHAFGRDGGAELWTVAVGEQVESVALRNGTVYVGTFSPSLVAVDAADGTETWRTEAEGNRFVAGKLAATGDAVYAGANGDLRAFDASDGTERWRVTHGDRPAVQSPPAVGAGSVLVNIGDSLRAFDPADGTERWTRTTGGSNRPPVVRDGVVYAAGDGTVHAFDAGDGSERWRTDVGEDLQLAAGAGAVYGTGFETPALALDPADGRELWRHDGPRVTTAPAVAGDSLLVGGDTGRVRLLGPDG
jgi:outer membrane protein assembly factor BamB